MISDTANVTVKGKLAIDSGDGQQGAPGATLSEPLKISVTDSQGNGIASVAIAFSIASQPQGANTSLSRYNTTTDSGGYAETTLTLGSKPGEYQVKATGTNTDPTSVIFKAKAIAHLVRVSGNGQSGALGTTLPNPLKVRVVDNEGHGISGIGITFAVGTWWQTLWEARVNPPSAITNSEGYAETTLTLGNKPGTYSVVATGTNTDPESVTFTATATRKITITITRQNPPDSPPNDKTFITTDNITLKAKVMSGTTDVTSQASITWSGGGTPATGSGSTFSTKYSTASNHTVTASASYQGSSASDRFTLQQDEIDRCRQEYVNANYTRPIPGRSRFTKTKHSQHYSFNDLNDGNYSWAIIEQGLLNGLEATGTNYPNHWEDLSSAYRNPVRNASLPGASPTSWHLEGRAADIDGDSDAENDRIFEAAGQTNPIEILRRRRYVHVAW